MGRRRLALKSAMGETGKEDFIGPSSNRAKAKFTVSKTSSFCICMFRALLQTCNTCLNKGSKLNVHKVTGGKANKTCKTFTRISQNGARKKQCSLALDMCNSVSCPVVS